MVGQFVTWLTSLTYLAWQCVKVNENSWAIPNELTAVSIDVLTMVNMKMCRLGCYMLNCSRAHKFNSWRDFSWYPHFSKWHGRQTEGNHSLKQKKWKAVNWCRFYIVSLHGTRVPSEPGPPHLWRSGAPNSVGLTQTCYRLRRDLYLRTHNAHPRDTHAPGGTRIRNLSKWATANPHLRPLGDRDRPILHIAQINKNWECRIFLSANGRAQPVPVAARSKA